MLKPDFSAEGIYGGHLLGVRGASALSFYDWQTTHLIRRIDIDCRNVYWADNGTLVAIATADSFFVLKCGGDAAALAFPGPAHPHLARAQVQRHGRCRGRGRGHAHRRRGP